jgi:excisionase family DNA binding protein
MKHTVHLGHKVYYSPRDLAMFLSVAESTIKRWADSGKLRCFRTLGNHRRFTIDVILEFAALHHMELSLPPELMIGTPARGDRQTT